MASRTLAARTSRCLRRAFRPLLIPAFANCHRQTMLNLNPTLPRPDQTSCFPGKDRHSQLRSMSTSIGHLPAVSDPEVLQALHRLLAVNWTEIPDEAEDAVETALTKKTDDTAGQEELKNAWRAAEAVEKFSGTLVSLRMTLDDLNGPSGEKVRPLPPLLVDALKSALSRYNTYLAAFKEEEFYLKKKVEVELGSLLIHIGQRCSGLGPEWGNVSLLGTSGISGSFIEHRAQ